MKASLFLSLGLIVILHVCAGLAAESSSEDAQEKDSSSPSLSREKRGSYNMMRLGRGLRMLRLGKRSGGPPDVPEMPQDELQALLEEYYSQFPDTLEDEMTEEEMHPRFRRSTPAMAEMSSPDQQEEEEKALEGQGLQEDELPVFDDGFEFYPEDFYGDVDGLYEPDEGGLDLDNELDSQVRLGRNAAEEENSDGEVDKRPMSMLRLGKRPMSMLRLGKRPMSMLRLGKRPMSMLRLGKRPMSMLRLGKRPMSMLRLGKRPMSMLRLGKRPMSMLRLGKRPMSMLRLGKRPMSMLRLGKRPMSMLRLGKRPMSMLRLGKRPMSMLRLGKRPMSMLRLGKRDAELPEEKRQLPMFRLGKKSPA